MKRISMFLFLGSVTVMASGCPTAGGLYGGGGNNNNNDSGGGNGGPGVEVTFKATLSGDQEAPPVQSNGTGTGTFTLKADATELTFEFTASGLSGPVIASHFHKGAIGVAGAVLFEITDTITENADGTLTASGTWPVNASDVTALLDGNVYVNLHTADHTLGEIRGQLLEQP
jgi:hypothetical protein